MSLLRPQKQGATFKGSSNVRQQVSVWRHPFSFCQRGKNCLACLSFFKPITLLLGPGCSDSGSELESPDGLNPQSTSGDSNWGGETECRALYRAFLPTQSALQNNSAHPFTHIHRRCQPLGTHTYTFRLSSHQEKFRIQYFVQGHFDMWTGGARDQIPWHSVYLLSDNHHHLCSWYNKCVSAQWCIYPLCSNIHWWCLKSPDIY